MDEDEERSECSQYLKHQENTMWPHDRWALTVRGSPFETADSADFTDFEGVIGG